MPTKLGILEQQQKVDAIKTWPNEKQQKYKQCN